MLVDAQAIQFINPDFSDALRPIVDVRPLPGHFFHSVSFVDEPSYMGTFSSARRHVTHSIRDDAECDDEEAGCPLHDQQRLSAVRGQAAARGVAIGDVRGPRPCRNEQTADGEVLRHLRAGHDSFNGGAGLDTFTYRSISDSTYSSTGCDTIYDFSSQDKIDLAHIDANQKVSANQAFTYIGKAAFHRAAGELRFEKQASDTDIYGDVNGDKKADFAIHLDDAVDIYKAFFIL
ncbi:MULTISPECIES: M10 family metallopeptidase C-terminal domain-containing protein [unclassified Rhizobium]|uniref:M10 family metallopeptidase C-terminal domain-containing protein n=1 Tax=unclassified Rhizobium TaxID=2613769 RepID=UPI001FCCEB95|nr:MULTISPECIES: hypothetical protein [unclassified Rhizobium]